MKPLAALALFALAAACARPLAFAPGTGAIVEARVLTYATSGRLGIRDEGAWTPTQEDVRGLEPVLLRRLIPELHQDEQDFKVKASAPAGYYRRYAGVHAQGRRVIAVCGELISLYAEHGGWPDNYVPLRDGGSATFGAYYDPATRAITYFEFGFNA